MQTAPTQDQLNAWVAEWQKRLRVQDWVVKIQLRRKSWMSLENSQGTCTWENAKKMAAIEILDPVDFEKTSWGWEQDIERIIVHELLHLHFAPFATNDEPLNTQHEQAIDLIAGALIEAKRSALPESGS